MSGADIHWQTAAEQALGDSIRVLASVGGGDFAEAYRAELASGKSVFIKTHRAPPLGFFTTEAKGLSWLRSSGTVAIPEVLTVSDDPPFLALEWIDIGQRPSMDDGELGRSLALLHKQPFKCFGRPDGCTTGSLAMPNKPSQDWATFYATQRLLPLADIAESRGALPDNGIRGLRLISSLLKQWQLDEPVSLLHGDLWAGNRVCDAKGKSWLIDPAAHGGSREFDIAMMMLFGGYDESCLKAYNEEYPLQAEWQSRISLHQLAPLTVHAIKFGGSYRGATLAALKKYL
ncbi:MAG: fructosamine kinase family protein [Granulosicoccaceae bacterium]